MGAVLLYVEISFILHLLWENIQAPLFTGYTSPSENFFISIKAASTGDMIFMAIIYAALAVVHRSWNWPVVPSVLRHPATWVLSVLIGVLLAVSFELWAVYVDHRWIYGAMPIIPLLHVGVTPILQLIVIPLLTLAILEFAQRRKGLFRSHE